MVTVDMLNIHHNTKVWKTPSQFIPERFAEDGEASQIAGEGFPWLPFGNGPRTCIGKNFSMVEQYVFLSMLCKYYSFHVPDLSAKRSNCSEKIHLELTRKFSSQRQCESKGYGCHLP